MTIHSTPLGRALKAVLWGLFFAVAAGTTPVRAVHDEGVFELDANAVDDAAAGIDWANVYSSPGTDQTFISDPVNSNTDNTFAGGGSKDERDISNSGITTNYWGNTSTKPPDKDDLEHAYAAFFNVGTDQVIYFGADRFSNSGDSAIGFWFFKDQVSVNSDGTFTGVHNEGDILVTSDFLQGGGDSVINVFEWSGDASNPLTLLAHSEIKNGVPLGGTVDPDTGLFCTTADTACAVANEANADAPWTYTFKGSGTRTTFPPGTFFEGGINLTALLGGAQCYSTFMAMTRTSASTTAQLKDFVIGPFATCSIGVSKTCTVERLTTDEEYASTSKLFYVSYSGSVTNTGNAPLPIGTVISVRDNAGTPDPATSDDDSHTLPALTSELAPAGTVSFSGTFFSNDNPPHNTVYAKATFGDNVLTDSYAVDCSSLDLSPDLSLTKTCGSSDGTKPGTELVAYGEDPQVLALQVNVSGTVCNTSTTPGLDLDVTVTDDAVGLTSDDDPNAVVFTGTLVQGPEGTEGRCANYDFSYLPAAGDGSTSPAGGAIFSDTVTAVGKNPALSAAEEPTTQYTAHCSVCACEEPTLRLQPSLRSH